MTLEELEVYQSAMAIAQRLRDRVLQWDPFARDVVGRQMIRAADSMAANLGEGFGRYFYRENRQFCFYSRGSLLETKTWVEKARARNLIAGSEANQAV